jgi:hypothetical protein
MVAKSMALDRFMSSYQQDALQDHGRSEALAADDDVTLRPTCILGMHRSGTSFAARLVNLLGIDLGPESIHFKPTPDNPKGYWEHSGIVAINDEILQRLGGRWDHLPVRDDGWVRDPGLDDLRERARHLIATDFSPRGRWGWKDPRTCITLPFWRDIVGGMQYVLVVRNPCAVIASLSRRDGMSYEQAEALWLQHVSASLSNTAGERRLFVFYDDFLRETPRELQRLAMFLGVPVRTTDPSVLTAATEFVEPDLCHHRMSLEDAAVDRRLSFVTKGLYLALRGHAIRSPDSVWSDAPHSRSVHRALDALGAGASDAWCRLTSVETLTHENQVRDRTIGALSAECDRLREEAAALGTQVARLADACRDERSARTAAELARDQEAHASATAKQRRDQERQARIVAEQARAVDALARAAAERKGEAANQARRTAEEALETASARLAAIETSTAWRMVCAFRRGLIRFAPGGSIRRRAWIAALRWMGGRAVDPAAGDGTSMRA